MSGLRPPRARSAAVVGAVILALLAGCGDDGGDSSPEPGSSAGEAGEMGNMGEMDMSQMNEPDATPADEVDGEVESGEFEVLDTAPPGSEGVSGTAWLAQDDTGTTVTIEVDGLEPGRAYVSHLHAQSCEEDSGGDHFTFDPDGGDTPPNEVHLAFTAAEDGSGGATVTNDEQVGDLAPAVVVHPVDAVDNRLACADFS